MIEKNIEINVVDKSKGDMPIEVISTSGYVILYLDEGRAKFKGDMDIKFLAKLALEKFMR